MAWTVHHRVRGKWGPDDYYIKNRGKVLGFWPTKAQAEAEAKRKNAEEQRDKKK